MLFHGQADEFIGLAPRVFQVIVLAMATPL
jgi:hypothetical protein